MRLADFFGFLIVGMIGAGSCVAGLVWLDVLHFPWQRGRSDLRPFTPTAHVSREPTPATAYDKASALFFYRAPHERFMYVTAGPYELTGGMDVPALMFQRQGPDGLWYTIEAYPVGFDSWDKARAYDTDAINGRPLNKEDDK